MSNPHSICQFKQLISIRESTWCVSLQLTVQSYGTGLIGNFGRNGLALIVMMMSEMIDWINGGGLDASVNPFLQINFSSKTEIRNGKWASIMNENISFGWLIFHLKWLNSTSQKRPAAFNNTVFPPFKLNLSPRLSSPIPLSTPKQKTRITFSNQKETLPNHE